MAHAGYLVMIIKLKNQSTPFDIIYFLNSIMTLVLLCPNIFYVLILCNWRGSNSYTTKHKITLDVMSF